MGRPVVHFEVMGKDGEKLRSLYAELFHWVIDADNPLGYVCCWLPGERATSVRIRSRRSLARGTESAS
jgi:predicted enzyme related to lactoylglutathione lyase